MTKVEKNFLEAVKAFLKNETVSWDMADEFDFGFWNALFVLAREQGMLPMVYESVRCCKAYEGCDAIIRKQVQSDIRMIVAGDMMRTEYFMDLYAKFLKEGLTPLVVKGSACKPLYSRPEYRISGDEDLFLERKDALRCHEFLKDNGFKAEWSPGHEIPGEITYVCTEKGLRLEVHYDFFPGNTPAYGGLNAFFGEAIKKKVRKEIYGKEIYTLEPSDQILYLIGHAFKHFVHSGFGVRQVCDLVLYANANKDAIDWEGVWENCRGIHAEIFTAMLFEIAEKYLVDQIPSETSVFQRGLQEGIDSTDLLSDMLEGGVFGDSSLSRKHSSTITLNAVAASRIREKTSGSLVPWRTIFPERAYLKERYPYLEKHSCLLPAAWFSRLLKYFAQTREVSHNNAIESVDIGNRRLEMLKKYKVL